MTPCHVRVHHSVGHDFRLQLAASLLVSIRGIDTHIAAVSTRLRYEYNIIYIVYFFGLLYIIMGDG